MSFLLVLISIGEVKPVAQMLMLELPDTIYERVVRTAVAMKQPVEKALVHLIESGLPPLEAPAEFEADLRALEALDDDALWEVLLSEMPAASQRRLHRLLDKNSEGTLTIRERRELEALRKEGDCLMLRKAHAAVILKWRGHRIPTVDELRKLRKPR